MKTAEELIADSADRWRSCEGLPECLLLRLSILRQLLHLFHAEKSHLLAFGKRDEAGRLRDWVTKIEDLRERAQLGDELMEVIQKPSSEPKKKRLLPTGLTRVLSKEKFERYDRQWENTLAAIGAGLGWGFFSLSAWVQVHQIEAWDEGLKERLWPHGIVLFTEAIETSSPTVSEGLWQGRWIIMIHPSYKNPADVGIDFSLFSGTPDRAPSKPAWRLLFSPKAH